MKRTIKTVIFAIFTFAFIANASAIIITFDFTGLGTMDLGNTWTSDPINVVEGDADWGTITITATSQTAENLSARVAGLGVFEGAGALLDGAEQILFEITHNVTVNSPIGINISEIGFPDLTTSPGFTALPAPADQVNVSGMNYTATGPTTALDVEGQNLGDTVMIGVDGGGFRISSISASVVIPEPSSVMLMAAITTAGIFIVRRRRTQA